MKSIRFTKVEYLVLFGIALGFSVLFGGLVGCDVPTARQSADQRQAAETNLSLAEADRQIGMPDITRFTERKLARDILELGDKEITTYCYIVNLQGELIFIGEAIGFGLPYSVQYTNPERDYSSNHRLESRTLTRG